MRSATAAHALLAILLSIACFALLGGVLGCHSHQGTAPLHMTDQAALTTSNALAAVGTVATAAPGTPLGAAVQAASALALALLAAWQTAAHKRITKLENGKTPTTPTPKI